MSMDDLFSAAQPSVPLEDLGFGSSAPAKPAAAAAAPAMNGSHKDDGAAAAAAAATGTPKPSAAAAAAGANSTAQPDVKVDTPYSQWERKRQDILLQKQLKADETKRSLQAAAKDDIKKYYAQREDQIAARKRDNRGEEKASRAALAELMSHGAMFEKVGKLVDTGPKANEKRPQVDRMRKLLVGLKQNPPPHVAAGSSSSSSSAPPQSNKDNKG